jgi:hypothetical protein
VSIPVRISCIYIERLVMELDVSIIYPCLYAYMCAYLFVCIYIDMASG